MPQVWTDELNGKLLDGPQGHKKDMGKKDFRKWGKREEDRALKRHESSGPLKY